MAKVGLAKVGFDQLGQLMWLATQVVPQLQAPLSLLLGYLACQQDILGTSGKSYQCDQLAQWQVGQSGTKFQICRAASSS